jgi:hypothetical protein
VIPEAGTDEELKTCLLEKVRTMPCLACGCPVVSMYRLKVNLCYDCILLTFDFREEKSAH